MVIACVHALAFAIIWILMSKYVWMVGAGLEEYDEPYTNKPCKSGW
jgi:hypothetical protein